jgi:hypothetical protein
MTVADMLDTLGINARVVAAGFAGGLLRALSHRHYKLREIFISPFCGVLAAINLTASGVHALTQVGRILSWDMPVDAISTQRAVAFLIGVSAMWISDFLFEYLARKIKPVPEGN